jgi:hypothetical protein
MTNGRPTPLNARNDSTSDACRRGAHRTFNERPMCSHGAMGVFVNVGFLDYGTVIFTG